MNYSYNLTFGACQGYCEVGARANYIIFLTQIRLLFFFNSLSGCPIAAAEKLAMSQDKSQLDSAKTGQCPDQGHRYDAPLGFPLLPACRAPTQRVPLLPGSSSPWATFVPMPSHQCPLERLGQLTMLSLK